MLSTFTKIYFNKDQQVLEKIANEICDSARNSTNKLRKKKFKTFGSSFFQTVCDTHIFLVNTIGPMKTPSFWSEALSSGLFFYNLVSDELEETYRTLTMNLLTQFNFVHRINDVTLSLGVKPSLVPFTCATIYSGYQVLVLRCAHGFHTTSLVDFATSTLAIAGIHACSTFVARFISKKLPFLPYMVYCFPLAYASTYLVQRIGIYGIPSAWNYLQESFLDFVIKMTNKHKERPEIPLDVEIPTQLQCAICRDLLFDPVESLGFFFCSGCLNEWMKKSHTHPVTGEQISNENINKSIEMSAVVSAYLRNMERTMNQ